MDDKVVWKFLFFFLVLACLHNREQSESYFNIHKSLCCIITSSNSIPTVFCKLYNDSGHINGILKQVLVTHFHIGLLQHSYSIDWLNLYSWSGYWTATLSFCNFQPYYTWADEVCSVVKSLNMFKDEWWFYLCVCSWTYNKNIKTKNNQAYCSPNMADTQNQLYILLLWLFAHVGIKC